MTNVGLNNTKRMSQLKRDSLETEKPASISGFGSSLAKNVGQSFADLAGGMFDQLVNTSHENGNNQEQQQPQQEQQPAQHGGLRERGTFFRFAELEEQRELNEVKELIKQIKKEVDAIRKQDAALLNNVKDVENLAINSMPEKIGIYHIRFLEIVLKMLQALHAQIGESNTWMQALISKKKKRGSLFASRSQDKGTIYSMSQELSNARSIQ